MKTLEEGERLIRQGQWVLERELQTAFEEGNFNLAVRRAQEVVELALKGGLRALGADYPKVHDVAPAFCEQVRQKSAAVDEEVLEQIRIVSLWLSEARGGMGAGTSRGSDRTVSAGERLIVLFGSYAYGKPTPPQRQRS